MNDVPLYRLYMLRALYLLIAVAMGSGVWSDILHGSAGWSKMGGVVTCMLGAFTALSLLGLRYPMQMLPLLLWEALWKTTWLLVVPLSQWLSTGQIDPAYASLTFDCSFVVLVYVAVPWGHVVRRFVKQDSERWSAGGGDASVAGAVVR